MLLTLWTAGYVTLEPEPPRTDDKSGTGLDISTGKGEPAGGEPPAAYRAHQAHATPELQKLLLLRGVNPLYGVFLVNQLGIADRNERIQALESVLELPPSVGYHLRVPPPGRTSPRPARDHTAGHSPAATGTRLPRSNWAPPRRNRRTRGDRSSKKNACSSSRWPTNCGCGSTTTSPTCTACGQRACGPLAKLLQYGDFNKFITSKGLQKQEGVIFRHLLRLILLIAELTQLCPPDTTPEEWQEDLNDIADKMTDICHRVDSSSTDKTLQQAKAAVESETY